MPADRLDLAARLAAATRHDTVRGATLNTLFDLVRHHADEATALLCDPLGKGRRSEFVAYPVADALQVAWAAADRLERKLGGVDQAFDEAGHRVASDFLGTWRGRLRLLVNRTPRGLLGQLPVVYRTSVSFGQRYLTCREATRCVVELEHDFFPLAYHRGVVRALLDAAGVKGGSVEGTVPGFLKATIEVRWG
jgi:uncharacterized protein (TIGR02265 family)